MKIVSAQQTEFDDLDGPRQIISDANATRFALLQLGPRFGTYGLSWMSSHIEPTIETSADGKTLWIGVDTYLVGLDLENGAIRFAVQLPAHLLNILIAKRVVIIVTEIELMVLNNDRTIYTTYDLPDIPEVVEVVEGQIVVKLMNGESLTRAIY